MTSPRLKARIAGFLYLVVILCGAFAGGFVRQGRIGSGAKGSGCVYCDK